MARIAFFLPDLGGGGTERLTLELVRLCLGRGHAVDLVLMRSRGELLQLVPDGARIVELCVERIALGVVPLRRYIVANRPDLLIAAMWPLTVIAVLATRLLRHRPRLILSEHAPLSRQYAERRRWLRLTIALAYRLADGIVGVSDGVARDVAALGGLAGQRVATIYNPVRLPDRSAGSAAWPGRGARVLAVGGLKAVKNHALLIDAFALLPPECDAVLVIVGEGEERAALQARILALGLAAQVRLAGFSMTPGDWYASADLFVHSSDYEGMGLVLVEALGFGLPVVATDCPSGPAEVLADGRWGRLVPPGDPHALAGAMAEALAEGRGEPERISARKARAAQFDPERALDAYLALAGVA